MTRDLLPSAVTADPDDHGTVLTLLNLATIPATERENRRVYDEVTVRPEYLVLRSVHDGVEDGSSLAEVREPFRARQALTARIDEEVFLREEALDGSHVGATQRIIIVTNRLTQLASIAALAGCCARAEVAEIRRSAHTESTRGWYRRVWSIGPLLSGNEINTVPPRAGPRTAPNLCRGAR